MVGEPGRYDRQGGRCSFPAVPFATRSNEPTRKSRKPVTTFRPHYGKKLWALPKYLSDHDRTTITSDVEPDSGKQASADAIVAETVAKVRPGSIVLLHGMGQGNQSLAAIARIVSELRSAGYQFVMVSELLKH